MPDWAPLLLLAVFLSGVLCWLVLGTLAAIGAVRGAVHFAQFLARRPRDTEKRIFLACHHADCGGHMAIEHRYTTAGLICTGCGRPTA